MMNRIFLRISIAALTACLFLFSTPDRSDAGLVSVMCRILSTGVKRLFPSGIERKLLKEGARVTVQGRKVFKRNDLFDSRAADAFGRTNLHRMRQGLAPIGHDGFPIELHHMKQKNDGAILEISRTLHRKHYSDLHRYTKNSEIDRMEFEGWKRSYWKTRAEGF